MALADKYLYDGERILALLPGDGFLQERELAATESRVIYARPGKFCDVTYDCLSSVGCGSIYQPAWACASFVFTALAIAFARAAAFVPGSLSFGPFNVGLGWLSSLIGFPGVLCGALAIAAAIIFLSHRADGNLSAVAGRQAASSAMAGTGRNRPWRSQRPSVRRAFERPDLLLREIFNIFIYTETLCTVVHPADVQR